VDSQARPRWIGPILAAAVVVLALGVFLGMRVVTQLPAPSAAPSEPEPEALLLEPGEVVTIDALDARGSWGTIAITRGPDTGGDVNNPLDPDAFIIEVFIDYSAVRHPEPEAFGREDWALVTAADRRPVGSLHQWVLPPNPAEWDPTRQELMTYPGAIEILGTPTEGMLYFLVPRELADDNLELIYRPAGFSEAVAGILLREPGPAPAPAATATPAATPEPVAYVPREGLPFSVIESAKADALFIDADTCTNPVGGFTVAYPDSWYTNTDFGSVPACSWFSPTPYEVTTSDEVPDEVVITITVIPGPLGSFTQPELSLHEEVPIGGFAGYRREEVGVTYEGGGHEALPPSYHYFVVRGDPRGDAPRILASSESEGALDYSLNKAVLDRIMASLDFHD